MMYQKKKKGKKDRKGKERKAKEGYWPIWVILKTKIAF